jgi:UDP-N-acetylmuramyl pentapeptide phosphotransferase/UDP-N-acetylglucosamine-1-phosphate transferase
MQEPHTSAASGPITYGLGAAAATVSQMSANEWLIILSIIAVLVRIYVDVSNFIEQRAEKRAKRDAEKLAQAVKFGCVPESDEA